MTRRVLDQYWTPDTAVAELIKYTDWWTHDSLGLIFEPTVGDGNIVKALQKYNVTNPVVTNDIDPKMKAMAHLDATEDKVWRFLEGSSFGPPMYTVGNPPFSEAPKIVEKALRHTQISVMMLLRISFLEGCYDRRWLVSKPPTNLLVLPRISFTGDGGMDNVTCAWFIWNMDQLNSSIKIVSNYQ